MNGPRFLLSFVIGALVLNALPLYTSAAELEKGGTRPATKEDLEWMKWAGLPEVKEGVLVSPDNPYIGKEIGEIKKWLSEHATKNAKIRCLNPDFARRLKSFMEDTQGGIPVITDAYRSQNEQQAIINKGDGSTRVKSACESYHPWGLAADFNQNNAAQTRWMRANAKNPKYALGILGEWDPNHMQNGSGKTGQCGVCQADGPDGALPPASASPSAGFANTIRQALGLQQQPLLPQQQPLPSQPLPQSQNPINSFQDQQPLLTATSSNDGTATSSSIADRLEQLINAEATSTRSATSVPIVINPYDIGTITSTQNPNTTQTTNGVGGAVSQNTFTSGDLAWQTQNNSSNGMLTILNNIKTTLLSMLQYLRPFGGATHPVESTGIYLE